ncbi:hypothetical protein BH09PLA1_BH09PLA1_08250 [soil metagenome]
MPVLRRWASNSFNSGKSLSQSIRDSQYICGEIDVPESFPTPFDYPASATRDSWRRQAAPLPPLNICSSDERIARPTSHPRLLRQPLALRGIALHALSRQRSPLQKLLAQLGEEVTLRLRSGQAVGAGNRDLFMPGRSAIHIAAVSDAVDAHDAHCVSDFIHDAVVTDADSPIVL